jgi:cell division protein FtsQ
MTPVSAPSDKRFRRAHVKPSRRRGSWRALIRPAAKITVLSVLGLYAAYRGGTAVMHAGMLQVDRIVVRGTDRLSVGEVLAVLNGLRGQNIVWADLSVWRQRLLSSPWVRDAALRRSLPSTVEVIVFEREPIGIARLGGDLYLIDEQAVVIDAYGPQYADVDLPIIDGLTAPTASPTPQLDEAHSEFAGRLMSALRARPEVARRVSQVDVSDLHNAALILSGDPAVIYVGDDRFLSRLQSYLELGQALRERVPDIDYVDLRFDDRIYVRPTGGPRRQVSGLNAGVVSP